MFGVGPLELVLGGLCCSGVVIGAGAIAGLTVSMNRQKHEQHNLESPFGTLEANESSREEDRLNRDKSTEGSSEPRV
jgi:hypothetical protein